MESVSSSSSKGSSPEPLEFGEVPAIDVGKRRVLKITTYEELHVHVKELVSILEEVYEVGILKGTASQARYRMNRSVLELTQCTNLHDTCMMD